MEAKKRKKRFAAAGRYHHRYPPRNTGRKTFRIVRPDGTKLFEHMPGQCAMLCVPGVGEALFSITSSPTNKEYQEFSIKECGTLTNYLHNMSVGDEILVRGPYGNHFPVETVLKGQDLLFIAGGIGLAPLRFCY